MKEFTIYCTPEQTKKAFELGAPIKAAQDHSNGNVTENLCVYGDIINKDKWGIGECTILHIPTAGQMLGWLEEQGFWYINIMYYVVGDCWNYYGVTNGGHDSIGYNVPSYNSRKEATLAAIDTALDYLIKKENNNYEVL